MAGSSSGSSSSVVGGVAVAGITGLEPTSPTSLPPYQVKAMETIFIKEVQANGPAHYANLQTGDRVLMVNNQPIAGIAYSTIVSMIKQTPTVLTLHVVPKECDVLQMVRFWDGTPRGITEKGYPDHRSATIFKVPKLGDITEICL